MDARSTRERILDSAEELFAEGGFATSLRSITSDAGVNLASVNYHFGSKEALIETVFSRRLEPGSDCSTGSRHAAWTRARSSRFSRRSSGRRSA